MINGLYTAASGMNAEMARQDAIANNLANVNTTGFKKDVAVFKAFPNMLVSRINDRMDPKAMQLNPCADPGTAPLGMIGHGSQVEMVATDFSEGNLTRTDQPLDLAIDGQALFTVELADGSRAYTRAGNFTLDSEGKLVTSGGNTVLSRRGSAIKLSGNNTVIDKDGRIVVDGVEADRLLMTRFESVNDLVKRGENLYTSKDSVGLSSEEGDLKATVQQGFLESANVQVAREMVDMINVMRAYEANQKTVQVMDATLDKAVNEVGRV